MGIINIIETNLGMSVEIILSIIVLLAIFIFYASDFRIGALLHILGFASLTVLFYTNNMLYKIPLVLMFIFIVVLTFSIFAVNKVAQRGGYI